MNKSERDKEISRLLEEGRHRTCEPGTNVMDEPVGYEYKNYKKRERFESMKMKIIETTKSEVEVDVTFPIYREHDVGSDYHSTVIYTKIDQGKGGKFIEHTIKISGSTVDVEIDRNYRFDSSGTDYLLGKGLYKSSEDEFRDAVTQAKALIDEIVAGAGGGES